MQGIGHPADSPEGLVAGVVSGEENLVALGRLEARDPHAGAVSWSGCLSPSPAHAPELVHAESAVALPAARPRLDDPHETTGRRRRGAQALELVAELDDGCVHSGA